IFASSPFYSFYADAPRLWGLSPIRDQNLAGILMNAEQTSIVFFAFAWALLRVLAEEEEQQRLHDAAFLEAHRHYSPTRDQGVPPHPGRRVLHALGVDPARVPRRRAPRHLSADARDVPRLDLRARRARDRRPPRRLPAPALQGRDPGQLAARRLLL